MVTVWHTWRVSHRQPAPVNDEQRGNLLTSPSSYQSQTSALSGSLALRSRGLVSMNTFISACLYSQRLVSLGKKRAGGQWLQFYLVWGERAVPPPSCELSSNEMEMLSGLPGTVPALCSTDKVATLMGVWLLLEHGSNSSSATVYQLAPAINVADCLGVYQHNSCATERTDVCVCCRLNKGGKTNIFCFKSHGGKVKWKSKQQTFYLIQPLNLLNIWKVDLKDRKTMRLHAWIVHRAW